MMLDVGNSWQRKNTGRVTIQRGNKAEAERAAQGTYEPVYFECLKGTEKKIVPIERDNGETARHALQDHK